MTSVTNPVTDDSKVAADYIVLHQSSPNFAFTQPASTIAYHNSSQEGEDGDSMVMNHRPQQNPINQGVVVPSPPFTGLATDKQLNESQDILNEM